MPVSIKPSRLVAFALFLLVASSTLSAQAAGVRWQTDLEMAKRQAATSGKLVLLHFWTPSCGPCRKLDNTVFNLDSVGQSVDANYVPVKVNANDFPTLAHQFQIRSVPTDIILTPEGQIVSKFASSEERKRVSNAQGFVNELGRVAAARPKQNNMAIASRPTQIPGAAARYGNAAAGVVAGAAAQRLGAGSPAAPGNQAAPPASNPYAHLGQNMAAQGAAAQNKMGQALGAVGAANSRIPGHGAPNMNIPNSQNPNIPNPNIPSPRGANTGAVSYPSNPRIPGVAPQNSGLPSGATGNLPYGVGAGALNQQGAIPNNTANQKQPVVGMQGKNSAQTPSNYPCGPSGSNPMAPNPNIAANGAGQGSITPYGYSPAPNAAPSPAPQARPNPAVANVAPRPTGNPILGLEGYCPITLQNKNIAPEKRWRKGDPRWGAVHRGRTYLFSGPTEQQAFLANPDRYAPVLSGADSVVALESGRSLPGTRKHGLVYNNQVFLFSSEDSLKRFSQDPNRYAAGVRQAMQVQTIRQ